jgi:hypothetical protein
MYDRVRILPADKVRQGRPTYDLLDLQGRLIQRVSFPAGRRLVRLAGPASTPPQNRGGTVKIELYRLPGADR